MIEAGPIPRDRLIQANVPKAYRALAELIGDRSPSEFATQCKGDLERQLVYYRYASLAKEFAAAGAPTYVLSHSIAAALTATRSPVIPFTRCPYPAFFIEVPSEFLPLPEHPDCSNSPKRWISVMATAQMRAVALHAKGLGTILYILATDKDFGVQIKEDGLHKLSDPATRRFVFEMQLGVRLASNVIAYVTTYQENVTRRRQGDSNDVRLLDVAAPHDVTVDRDFRRCVGELVAARTVPRARGVLAHLVRGHWRRVSGSEDLIWIFPYQRGDLNIGRVVERFDRL